MWFRFWRRQFLADPWVLVSLAVLTMVVAAIATAVPRAMVTVADRQLDQSVAALSASNRDLSSRWSGLEAATDPREGGDRWGPVLDEAERVREAQPMPLRAAMQPAQLLATSAAFPYTPELATGFWQASIRPVINPRLTESTRLVAGAWPEQLADGPHQVALTRTVAERLQVDVGHDFGTGLVVSGIVEPVDEGADRWQLFDAGNRLDILVDGNRGESAIAWGYLAPNHNGSVHADQATPFDYLLWYPVDVSRLGTEVDVRLLAAQITGFLADSHPIFDVRGQRFTTALNGTLERVLDQQQAATTLVAIVAAGPVGVAAAVVLLAARLVVVRRRSTLELVTARGASPAQIRRQLGGEVAVLTVPAAALGHLAGLAVPGASPWWQFAVTLVVAAGPPGALVLASGSLNGRGRVDLTARAGRARWGIELAVLVLTGAATWQLVSRDDGSGGLDLLAVSTPILLALSACLLTLRVYPLPLAAILRALQRGRGVVGFLGAARALRDPSGGLVPTAAIVLGTTVALLSTVLLGTVTRGAETAVWDDVGAAIAINGRVSDEAVGQIRAIEGVTAVGRIGRTTLDRRLAVDGGDPSTVRVWVADDELQDVWVGSPRVSAPPGTLFDPDPVAVVVDSRVADATGAARLGELAVDVVETRADMPGISTGTPWVLVSRSAWEARGGETTSPQMAFVSAHPGADLDGIADAVRLVAPHVSTETVSGGLQRNADNAVVAALRVAFVGAALASTVLTALAVVVVQSLGARSRSELLAVLRTQGMRPGQARGLVAWELGPITVAALLVGAMLGAGIGILLAHTVDLTSLTGGDAPPAVHLDPWLMAGVLAAIALVVALAVAVSSWVAGRTNIAQALRIGEDR